MPNLWSDGEVYGDEDGYFEIEPMDCNRCNGKGCKVCDNAIADRYEAEKHTCAETDECAACLDNRMNS